MREFREGDIVRLSKQYMTANPSTRRRGEGKISIYPNGRLLDNRSRYVIKWRTGYQRYAVGKLRLVQRG